MILENIKIIRFAGLGKSIAKYKDMVIFVEGAIPDDLVDITISSKRKYFMEAKILRLKKAAGYRVQAFCKYFGTCGGCKWQHLDYPQQARYKQQEVMNQLEKIAKIPLPNCLPIITSEKTQYYRNKLEFTFSANRWLSKEEIASETSLDRNGLGFHLSGRFDKVLDIEKCYLQPDPSNQIRNAIRAYAKKHGFSFFNIRKQHGFLRNLIIRTATNGDIMVIVQVFEPLQKQIDALMEYLKNTFPQITSLYYIVNSKKNETFLDIEPVLFAGKPYIIEQIEHLTFKLRPKSFYQTNSLQAYYLYQVVRKFAALSGQENIYDLYTGVGTIALFLAPYAKRVIGIETVATAVEDAQKNAQENKIKNAFFKVGDVKSLLNEAFIQTHELPDVIVTDPPRAGMHRAVLNELLSIKAPRIVYVSCNPATQARDVALLAERYKITAIQPIDMFPHTYHVENIILLEIV